MREVIALNTRGEEGDGVGSTRAQGTARQIDFVAEFAGSVTHALCGFRLDVIFASQSGGCGGGSHSGQLADIL